MSAMWALSSPCLWLSFSSAGMGVSRLPSPIPPHGKCSNKRRHPLARFNETQVQVMRRQALAEPKPLLSTPPTNRIFGLLASNIGFIYNEA
jgi:hypothetical protein